MKRRILVTLAVMVGAWVVLSPLHPLRSVPVKAKVARARSDVVAISDAIDQYRQDYGRYPSTEEGFVDLVRVGMLRMVPHDPWHHRYEYRYPGVHQTKEFDLWSFGADGKPGGTGPDKDIGNWDDDA